MEIPRASQRAGQSASSTSDSESPETRAKGAKECLDLLAENLTDSSLASEWEDIECIPEDDFRDANRVMKRMFGYFKIFEKCIEENAKNDNWKNWLQKYWKLLINIGKTEQCTVTAFILSLQILEQGLKSEAFTSFSITDSEDRKKWVDKCGTLLDPDDQKELYVAMLRSVDKLLNVFGYNSFQDLSHAVKDGSKKMGELADTFDEDARHILFITLGHIGLSIGISLETYYRNTNYLRCISKVIKPVSFMEEIMSLASYKKSPTKNRSDEINDVMENLNLIENVMNALILVLKNLLEHMCETCTEWDQILTDGLSMKDYLNQILTYEREESKLELLFSVLVAFFMPKQSPQSEDDSGYWLLHEILNIVVVVRESWGDYKVAPGKAKALREAKDTLEMVNKKVQDAFQPSTSIPMSQ